MKHRVVEKRVDPVIWNSPVPIVPEEIPATTKEDYEARIKALFDMPKAKEYDTFVIYGDREHFSQVEYFTGYDVRWEETLLVLPREGKPAIIVGNEGIGYVQKVTIDCDFLFYQTFSLMGQPNDERSKTLLDLLKERISDKGNKLGLIGAKFYDPSKHTIKGLITDVPSYIVETIAQIVEKDRIENAADLLQNCEFGLKHNLSAKEIVQFEISGTKTSRGIFNCIKNLKPGMTETEAGLNCLLDASPLNMHPNINFGDPHVALGLASPQDGAALDYGMHCGAGYGMRGSLVHRVGIYARDRSDLPQGKEGYYDDFLIPYFENTVCWYEMLKIGTSYGDIYEMVDREIGLEAFGIALNPGHLTHTDEWTNSPFYKGSELKVRSGVAIQCDYTVTRQNPFMSAHMEDPLVIADEKLREEIKALSPSAWDRICKRRQFMIETLGIDLPEEVLPLSDLCGVCFPYMADTGVVLACEKQ